MIIKLLLNSINWKYVRRYQRNDWWDFMIVIDQELERSNTYKTYYNIADELKWRLVESISEGGNFKIKNKMKEIVTRFENNCSDRAERSEGELEEINALFDFVLSSQK